MTKEERLASVGLTNTPEGVAAFYDMFPDMESHDNYMANGGSLSGAPHDGQPTADEFFNYGSHANDAVNVPMSNPFFAANGGTPYYGGPVRPYDEGGNFTPEQYKQAQTDSMTLYNAGIASKKIPSYQFPNANEAAARLTNLNKETPTPNKGEFYGNVPGYTGGYNVGFQKPSMAPYNPASFTKQPTPVQEKPTSVNKQDWGSTTILKDGRHLRTYADGRTEIVGQPKTSMSLAGKAYGGYMDQGGNTASPTNYGAFNVPMAYGGNSEQFGGVLDPGNNQQYPVLEDGGRANLMAMIKAHSKKMRNDYKKEGGDTVMQGGNSDDYPTNLTNTFKNVLKQNMYNHMINEEEQAFSKEFMQMGGYQGQGMNYNTTSFNEEDPQNAAIRDMYKQRIAQYDTDLKDRSNDFSNAMYDLKATANPYTETSVSYAANGGTLPQAKYGDWDFSTEYQKSKRTNELRKALEDKKRVSMSGVSDEQLEKMAREEGLISDRDVSRDDSNNDYNRYFGQSERGRYNLPVNYNPYSNMSRKDVAMLQQLAKNPTTNLKEFKHNHFGPWGRTKMTFGYKDPSSSNPFTENKADPIQVDLNNNPNDISSEPGFQEEAMLPQYGPRIDKTPTSLQDGGFKSSRLGPQGQTVEMMMNPFNHGNANYEDDSNDEAYYPETMNSIQAGMPQMSYEDQEVNLADIVDNNPDTNSVSYRNTSDNKPKVINNEHLNKPSGNVKAVVKSTKGVPGPVKTSPAPRTLPQKANVRSTAPLPGVNYTPISPYIKNPKTHEAYDNPFGNTPKKVSTPTAKKLTQNTGDKRKAPDTGIVVDKRTNQAYYIGKKQSGSFPVLTGKNVESNYNPYTVEYLEKHPELRNTPVGYYMLNKPRIDNPFVRKNKDSYNYLMKDYAGKFRDITPISAYGQPTPVAENLGFHRAYSDNAFNPKDPEFVRRTKLLNSENPNMRCTSYGCVNVADASYDEIAKVFPTSDTLMVLDSKNPLDAEILKQFKIRAKQKKYGGLTRAQYGLDHKSTNPADGTYDNFGNPIGLSSASGNMGLASNNIISSPQGSAFTPVGNNSVAAPGAFPAAQGTIGPGSGAAAASISSAAANTKTPTPESVGLQQQNIEMKGMRDNSEKQATITSKQKPGYNGMAAAATIVAGIDTATSAINKAKDKSKGKLAELQLADNAYLANPTNAQSQGDYDPNSGMFRPNQMVPVQFAGYSAYGGSFQEGGAPDQAQPDPQQVMEGVAQMLQQGAQPEQVAQQLVQMGIPQEQVMQIIQTVMQQLQGGQQEQPAMRYGGYAMGGSPDDEEEEDDDDYYEADIDEDEIDRLEKLGYTVERY